uniref:Uncharacterized protein n=1 Tax=viral metagenome TaxID=1070528 RepID=A0A6H2A2A1_9ZZZZ
MTPEEARKQFGESLCKWLMNHYLVKTGNHYRILKEEMACIKQGKIPSKEVDNETQDGWLRLAGDR